MSKPFALDLSSYSVAVGLAILFSQHWILANLNVLTVAFIETQGNCPCFVYMFTNKTLNHLGFGMLTVGTAVFDCIF